MAKVVSFPLRQALLQRLWILLIFLILPLIPAMMAFINIYVLSSETTCFLGKLVVVNNDYSSVQ